MPLKTRGSVRQGEEAPSAAESPLAEEAPLAGQPPYHSYVEDYESDTALEEQQSHKGDDEDLEIIPTLWFSDTGPIEWNTRQPDAGPTREPVSLDNQRERLQRRFDPGRVSDGGDDRIERTEPLRSQNSREDLRQARPQSPRRLTRLEFDRAGQERGRIRWDSTPSRPPGSIDDHYNDDYDDDDYDNDDYDNDDRQDTTYYSSSDGASYDDEENETETEESEDEEEEKEDDKETRGQKEELFDFVESAGYSFYLAVKKNNTKLTTDDDARHTYSHPEAAAWREPKVVLSEDTSTELHVIQASEFMAQGNGFGRLTLICSDGPRKEPADSCSVQLRWLHVNRPALDLKVIERLVQNCPWIRQDIMSIALLTLDKVRDMYMRHSRLGVQVGPGCVVRCIGKYSDDDYDSSEPPETEPVVFLSSPKMMLQAPVAQPGSNKDNCYPQTLLQNLYGYNVGRTREAHQILEKMLDFKSKEILQVGNLWCMLIGTRILITFSNEAADKLRGESIALSSRTSGSGEPLIIRLIDQDLRRYDIAIESDYSYVDFLRHAVAHVRGSAGNATEYQLFDSDDGVLTPSKWIDILTSSSSQAHVFYLREKGWRRLPPPVLINPSTAPQSRSASSHRSRPASRTGRRPQSRMRSRPESSVSRPQRTGRYSERQSRQSSTARPSTSRTFRPRDHAVNWSLTSPFSPHNSRQASPVRGDSTERPYDSMHPQIRRRSRQRHSPNTGHEDPGEQDNLEKNLSRPSSPTEDIRKEIVVKRESPDETKSDPTLGAEASGPSDVFKADNTEDMDLKEEEGLGHLEDTKSEGESSLKKTESGDSLNSHNGALVSFGQRSHGVGEAQVLRNEPVHSEPAPERVRFAEDLHNSLSRMRARIAASADAPSQFRPSLSRSRTVGIESTRPQSRALTVRSIGQRSERRNADSRSVVSGPLLRAKPSWTRRSRPSSPTVAPRIEQHVSGDASSDKAITMALVINDRTALPNSSAKLERFDLGDPNDEETSQIAESTDNTDDEILIPLRESRPYRRSETSRLYQRQSMADREFLPQPRSSAYRRSYYSDRDTPYYDDPHGISREESSDSDQIYDEGVSRLGRSRVANCREPEHEVRMRSPNRDRDRSISPKTSLPVHDYTKWSSEKADFSDSTPRSSLERPWANKPENVDGVRRRGVRFKEVSPSDTPRAGQRPKKSTPIIPLPFLTWRSGNEPDVEERTPEVMDKLLVKILGRLHTSISNDVAGRLYVKTPKYTMHDLLLRHDLLTDAQKAQRDRPQSPPAVGDIQGAQASPGKGTVAFLRNTESPHEDKRKSSLAGSLKKTDKKKDDIHSAHHIEPKHAHFEEKHSHLEISGPGKLAMKQLLNVSQEILWAFTPQEGSTLIHNVCIRFWGAIDCIFRQLAWEDADRGPSDRRAYTIRNFDIRASIVGEVPQETSTMRKSWSNCAECCSGKHYTSAAEAIEHLHKVHLECNGKADRPYNDVCFVWLRRVWTDGYEFQKHGLGIISDVEDFIEDLQPISNSLKELHALVTSAPSKKSQNNEMSRPILPRKLVSAFHQIVLMYILLSQQLLLSNRRLYMGREAGSDELIGLIWRKTGEISKEMSRSLEQVQELLEDVKKDLILFGNTSYSMESLDVEAVGAEFIAMSLICGSQTMQIKPKGSDDLIAGSDLTTLYQEYMSELHFQAHRRPQRRVFLDIHALEEELAALEKVVTTQMTNIWQYNLVLSPSSFRITNTTRIGQHKLEYSTHMAHQKKLDQRIYEINLLKTRSKQLKEEVKQMIEILEEDHGKAIRVFTIVTLLFLPLSFVSSFMGMNTADVRDMEFSQRIFWATGIPITVVVLGLAFLYGYRGEQIGEWLENRMQNRHRAKARAAREDGWGTGKEGKRGRRTGEFEMRTSPSAMSEKQWLRHVDSDAMAMGPMGARNMRESHLSSWMRDPKAKLSRGTKNKGQTHLRRRVTGDSLLNPM